MARLSFRQAVKAAASEVDERRQNSRSRTRERESIDERCRQCAFDIDKLFVRKESEVREGPSDRRSWLISTGMK